MREPDILATSITEPSAWSPAYFWNVVLRGGLLEADVFAEHITGNLFKVGRTRRTYHRTIGLKSGVLAERITGQSA